MKRPSSLKLWHYIVLAALTGVLPMTALLFFVIGTSVKKDIDFGTQEMRGNAFQRPLEELLDLFPRYEAAARQALAGDDSATARMTDIQKQVDSQLETLSANYNGELGRAMKFTDAELASRKRENARLSVVLTGWQNLKNASLPVAAGDEAAGNLVASMRAMIAHAGDLSNLILDTDLDSYYLVDITLSTLPQTQQRLSDITLQIGDWLRAGTIATNQSQIAVMAAMLQQDDQDRITGGAQTPRRAGSTWNRRSVTTVATRPLLAAPRRAQAVAGRAVIRRTAPKAMMNAPATTESSSLCDPSRWPSPDAAAPSETKTTVNPAMNSPMPRSKGARGRSPGVSASSWATERPETIET